MSLAQSDKPSTAVAPALKQVYFSMFRIGAAISNDPQPVQLSLAQRQFNTITPENCMKWGAIHPKPKRWQFGPADGFVQFGERNGMWVVGHCLIWHHQIPAWVFQSDSGQPVSAETLQQRMAEHINTVVGRYRGRVNGWDVVNEALNEDGTLRQSQWWSILGPGYIAQAFALAHAADPNAELYYNDYNLTDPRKCAGAVNLVRQLKSAGVRIDAVGIQGHWHLDRPSIEAIEKTIIALHQAGVKVMITELDVDVLPRQIDGADIWQNRAYRPALDPYRTGLPVAEARRQAERYRQLFALFAKHRQKITRVTFWGTDDGHSWLNNWPVKGRTNYPLLFDRRLSPKPAFWSVIGRARLSQTQGESNAVE